jgi:hypothetical protein
MTTIGAAYMVLTVGLAGIGLIVVLGVLLFLWAKGRG